MKNPKLLIVPFDSTCFAILELTRAQYIYIYIFLHIRVGGISQGSELPWESIVEGWSSAT